MLLERIDWVIIAFFFVAILLVGIITSKRAGRNSAEFFLSGRNMPFWLLGISMVATTFSTDTPNLVTDLVRTHGVSGNWLWWAFLLTGMLTVFVYAKLWRRSGVMTDVEFYEIRYSGKPAAFLRGFRAIYLGVFFNVIIMATVSLAAIKIGSVMLKFSPVQTISVALVITVIYSSSGGLRAVLITDFYLFIFAMFGAIIAAVVACRLPQVGGLTGLITHENVVGRLSLLPDFSDPTLFIPVFIIPIAVQWWSVWYPGAEPGGGGYVAQRMLSAKNEKHAIGATLLFNCCHYALRPWPWIIVALASLIVYPDIASLKTAFPHVDPDIVKNDLAYPAMLTFLRPGLLGIVVASLIAAYMSTMSTHLNWGPSYIVNDFYKRFIKPDASEKQLVLIGRISTVVLTVLAGAMALLLENALQAFHIMLQIGAGTGLIFILRWFWWRINAFTELAGMIVSFLVALALLVIRKCQWATFDSSQELLIGVTITTTCWLIVTFLTRPTDSQTLRKFYRLIRPGGNGWNAVLRRAEADNDPIKETARPGDLPLGIICMVAGCFAVYSTVFAVGFYIYSKTTSAVICTIIALAAAVFLTKTWTKLQTK
jgi:SSS family solute:Na+ symporter